MWIFNRCSLTNLKKDIKNKLGMMKFPSFTHVSMALHDHQNLISQHEEKTSSNRAKKSKPVPHNSFQPFKKQNKSFVKIHPTQTTLNVEPQFASIKKNPYQFKGMDR